MPMQRQRFLLGRTFFLFVLLLGTVRAQTEFQVGLEAFQKRDYATALKEWRPLAEAGDADSQFRLGSLYGGGLGVPQDTAEAVKWYRMAAEQGVVEAANILGVTYQMGGRGFPADFAEALKWHRVAAEIGSANSQYAVGLAAQAGSGVPADYVEAAKWFRLAAEQGHGDAQLNLGILYSGLRNSASQSITEDFPEAIKWYEKAADQGIAQAQFNLARMVQNGVGTEKNLPLAVQHYQKAFSLGLVAAAFDVGAFFEYGRGVPADRKEAAKWYQAGADGRHAGCRLWVRAESGDAQAQVELGDMYLGGQGPLQDYEAAAQWLQKSAARGNSQGEFNLAVLYSGGLGVPQDDNLARQWIAKAAVHGNVPAALWAAGERGNVQSQFNLGMMFLAGKGVPASREQALSWLGKAAEQKNSAAQYQVAMLHHQSGEAGEAAKWYQLAAGQGVVGAQFNLGMMLVQGIGVPQDMVQAYAWFLLADEQGMERAAFAKKPLGEALSPTQIEQATQLAGKLRTARPASSKPPAAKP
ncbi:MAG: sel1 repeat family protein [Acidobacteria bacterium]|nr:sel1 repeat family protein [Acidobacteriota bacterium]